MRELKLQRLRSTYSAEEGRGLTGAIQGLLEWLSRYVEDPLCGCPYDKGPTIWVDASAP